MPDTSATLRALINAKRPFKEFDLDGVKLYARRPGSGEQNEINDLFNAAYKAERDKIEANEAEMALFKRGLIKQSIEDIIEYIVESDSGDYIFDARRMLDNPTDEEVEKKVAELKEIRKAEMKGNYDKDELVREALERRSHILSYTAATEATLRHVVVFTVYDENKERLFATIDDLIEVPEQVIAELSVKASEALRSREDDKKHDPLVRRGSKRSAKPSPSPAVPMVDTVPSSGP